MNTDPQFYLELYKNKFKYLIRTRIFQFYFEDRISDKNILQSVK